MNILRSKRQEWSSNLKRALKYMNTSKTGEIGMLQLADSFFPTGMYTTSSGLEALFYSDKKKMDVDGLSEIIKVYLKHQIGPADCSALGSAYESVQKKDLQKLIEVDNTLFSMKLIEEVRNASVRSGTQILNCVSSFILDYEVLNRYQNAVRDKRASGI